MDFVLGTHPSEIELPITLEMLATESAARYNPEKMASCDI